MKYKSYKVTATGQIITAECNSLHQYNILYELWKIGLPGAKVEPVKKPPKTDNHA